MKHLSFLAGVIAILFAVFFFSKDTTSENNLTSFHEDNNYKEGDLLVMLKHGIDPTSLLNDYSGIGLMHKESLVPELNIHLYQYDVSRSASVDALMSVMRNDDVAVVQFNHFVQERSFTPNDTRFAEQWDKNNTGQTGGTPDADIDGPEAWELARGGVTAMNDTIVVAIVDGGQQTNHPDLDTWLNWREIPANGIDDDNNGYIDDINGWNAATNNGTIPANNHGTHCAGIAGAIGNNGLGVAGVNLKVKTMPIVYGNSPSLEQSVVKAYGYAHKQRKLYNQSNGSQGAFVVATNSSFGVDRGQPANYPLWCGFFDSLGAVGILSAGAGPNINLNIDTEGDIPTACPSNYLISVTNTTNADVKNSGAGYGPINMDLGAPGTSILSTIPGSSYGLLTGTSMATPQVTGAIGLIYGGASSVFIQLAKSDPDSAALLFKQYILSSVDTLASLQTLVLSKGRLNIHKMLKKVEVTNVPVLNPFQIRTPSAGARIVTLPNSSTQYTITWDTSATGATYKWVFGSPTPNVRLLSVPAGTNSITLSSGQLDNILAGLGVSQGDSIVGQWDVWAHRVLPNVDSLKSGNGPRAITFKRQRPVLSSFNLVSPPSGTSVTTSANNTSQININWTRSGEGTTYKWKFGTPTISTTLLSLPSNNSGGDSSLTVVNSALDGILQGLGLNPGDSVTGQWAVWAYNSVDSTRSTQAFNITFKRQSRGDVIVVYDSTTTGGRASRDSVIANLSNLGSTFDIYNRKSNTGTASISFRGYKTVILLGEGTSIMSNVVKDSLKSYLQSGGTTVNSKAKLVIFAEDVGYHLDRAASTYYDAQFARETLGFEFIADRPGSTGNKGFTGVTINSGITDSTVGPWPDVIRKSATLPSAQLFDLYRFKQHPDSMSAVGRVGQNANIAVFGVDIESLRPSLNSPNASVVRRVLDGAIKFVNEIPTSISQTNSQIPVRFDLQQNYPNPFNPSTTISFSVPARSDVKLRVYDILGKEMITLVNGQKEAGNYSVRFDAAGLPSGAYFYRIEAGAFVSVKRMVLIK